MTLLERELEQLKDARWIAKSFHPDITLREYIQSLNKLIKEKREELRKSRCMHCGNYT